ncbi:class I SAM-dependent methyltransferase [Chloroflexota bacterium]
MINIKLARGILRLGSFIQSLAVVVMKPDDLIEFGRQTYSDPEDVMYWARDSRVDMDLNEAELELVEAIPKKQGKLLLLGVGGGRDAIPLAKMGFRVTGVDYIPAMVDVAIQNATRRGVTIGGLVQDISRLDVQAGAYDIVWIANEMYSCIPTRARRVEMVRRIAHALTRDGLFICQFRLHSGAKPSRKSMFLRRTVAAVALGNFAYESGDILWGNIEFTHEFSSEDTVRSELEEGGLSIVRLRANQAQYRGDAVCRKKEQVI